jgi:hypothetical protein
MACKASWRRKRGYFRTLRSEGAEFILKKGPRNRGGLDLFPHLVEIGRFWCGKGAESARS